MTIREYVATLTPSERRYAEAYGDFLAVGDPEPVRPDDVDPAVAKDIRVALDREWRARIHSSPALSGRLRIERGRRNS